MPGASVVVLDCDAEGRYRGELCRILEPAFAVEVHDLPWGGALPISLAGPGPVPIPPAQLPRRGSLVFILAPGGSVAPMLSLVEGVRRAHPTLPLIGVIDTPDPFEVEGLLSAAITDFVTPPLRSVDILPRVRRLLAHTGTRDPLQQVRRAALGLRELIGNSPEFLGQLERIPRVSRCDAGVLIVGETGTGKELFARGIHYLSPRSHAPFLPVNCGAIPVDLAESELFGHARGAYTGAVTSYPGLIREAEGGTLFLDEIDCLPAAGQVKLLRFLQDKEYRALGTTGMLKANVRVIAASNVAIDVAIREGRFRQDLYYRLNTIPFHLPPLRSRREDLPLLMRHFLHKYTAEHGKHITGFTQSAMQSLALYDWPGNIRELEHLIERAVVMAQGPTIEAQDVEVPAPGGSPADSFQRAKARAIEAFETRYICGLLVANEGNISQAARAAQKNRRAFWQLIRKYRIDVLRFKSPSHTRTVPAPPLG